MTSESPFGNLLVDLPYTFVAARIGKLERLEKCDARNYGAPALVLLMEAQIWGQR